MRRPSFRAIAPAVVAVWAIGSAMLWIRATDRALDEFAARASRLVASVQADIADAAAVGREDAVFLARSDAASALTENDIDATPLLQKLFVAYVEAHPHIFQMRWIGADGLERVRIERVGTQVHLASTLQNKEDRHYFRRARDLPAGAVYVSPLDLNIEHGKIEQPARPTLRFSTPIRSGTGESLGVFVINRDVSDLMRRVDRQRGHVAGDLVLVHQDGVYVSHPDPSRQWGRAGSRDLTTDHPAIAEWLARSRSGGTLRDDGVLAVASASGGPTLPRALLMTSESDAVAAQAPSFLPLAIAIASTGALIAIVFVFAWRQQRLARELQREGELRRVIAAREQRLAQAQERLVASARLAALAESSAALAHELRNPLGAIVNSAALLKSDSQVDPDSRKLMEIVLGECARLERAVADFLHLARRPDPRREPVDLARLAGEVIALAAHEPTLEGEIELSQVEVAQAAPEVLADPDEIRQVLWNLLSNAGKATRRAGGKRVTVRVEPTALDGKPAAALEVEDEGNGPPSERRDGAADPIAGHGIGLIVAAGIVARSGGKLDLLPRTEGNGACARVVLPATPIGDSQSTAVNRPAQPLPSSRAGTRTGT